MLQLVDTEDLKIGMYVTKVTIQSGKLTVTSGGKIKDQQSLQNLVNRGILQVQIDLSKSDHQTNQPGSDEQTSTYTNAAGLTYNQQLQHTLELQDQAKAIQGRLLKNVAKGKVKNLEEIDQITDQIITSAIDCDDAIFISTMLKSKDQYHLEHSVNCSILMVLFGRALGMDRATLSDLGKGALLMDIGMTKLPLLLTQKAGPLTEQETQRMQQHVDTGLKILEPLKTLSDISRIVIKQHHERLDGSGYPLGLNSEQISEYGKMAAIVDTYDALTSHRPYRNALKPDEALKKITDEALGLDDELVAKFISCIGANPVGSLVKLSSNRLAMVMRLNHHQPMSPVVMVFYNLTSKLDEVAQIDLSKTDEKIIGSVSPDDFGIGLSSFLKQSFFK